MMHRNGRKRNLFFTLILGLSVWGLFPNNLLAVDDDDSAEGFSPALTAAMRKVQNRYYAATGDFITWPACRCGTAAPHYPPPNFYEDDVLDLHRAFELVAALRDGFAGTYPLFLESFEVDNLTEVSFAYLNGADFPLPDNITVDTYKPITAQIDGYSARLVTLGKVLSCSALAFQAVTVAPVDNFTQAQQSIVNSWSTNGWLPMEEYPLPILPFNNVYEGYSTFVSNYTYGMILFHIFGGFYGPGSSTIYLQLTGSDPHAAHNPVPVDNRYHYYVTVNQTSFSQIIPSSQSTAQFLLNSEGYLYWNHVHQVIITTSIPSEEVDDTECGSDCTGSCSPPSGPGPRLKCIGVRYGLGTGSDGKSAGYLSIDEPLPSQALCSPPKPSS